VLRKLTKSSSYYSEHSRRNSRSARELCQIWDKRRGPKRKKAGSAVVARADRAFTPPLPSRFRAIGITAYLKNGGTLEKAAAMANHASTRTTQLDDRRRDEVSLDEVERIVI